MKPVLLSAGIYNMVWGALVIVLPHLFFDWVGMPRQQLPEIWQGVGMIVGVYGVGYAIAAFDPARHWPIVLVGFLGKVLGPIGVIDAVIRGRFPVPFLWINVFNDLIWLVPFTLILLWARRQNQS